MQPFTTHTGLAAAMLQDNINTDLIIPKQFLKTIHRRGLGRHLFHDLRYREDGSEDPGFVLNREPGRARQHPAGRRQLRLRLQPRARPLGPAGLRLPGSAGARPSPTSSPTTP